MSALADTTHRAGRLRRLTARTWSVLLAAWGAVAGVAPHVLHHVGPLAGAALVAGVAGRLLFAAIALAVSIPFLLRIHRRFKSRLAPAIALAAMAAMFALSSFVIGPALTRGDGAADRPGTQQPAGHLSHHSK